MAAAVQYLTDESGEKTAVVIPLSDYEDLLEDLHDLATVANRRNEPTTSQEDFVKELKRDGIIPG